MSEVFWMVVIGVLAMCGTCVWIVHQMGRQSREMHRHWEERKKRNLL